MPEYTRGVRRKRNPEHGRITAAIGRARKRGDHAAVRALRKQQRRLPGLDPNDPDYRRLRYVRYADDILLGFAGPRSEAEEIKRRLGQFLREELALELSETKTLITHARTSAARFLGYEITVQHDDRKITAGRRSVNGGIRLRVPREVIATKCARYMQRGKPERRPELMNETDHAIISHYGAEYRGIVQYYLLAGDVYRLDRLRWVMVTSLLKTLAGKHDSTVTKIARKYAATIQTPHGPRACMQAVVDRGEGKTAVGRHVRWHSAQAAEDRDPEGSRSRPSELPPQRADPSAPGGTVRDLRRTGEGARAPDPQTRRPRQARTAAARMGADHGQAPSQDPRGLRTLLRQHPPQEGRCVNHGTVAGEPGELKGSRRVREGARGNGAPPPPRLWPTSSTRTYDERHLARVREQAAWLSRRRRRWCRRGAVAGSLHRSSSYGVSAGAGRARRLDRSTNPRVAESHPGQPSRGLA